MVLEKQQVSVLTKVKLKYCSLSYHSQEALLSKFRTPATQLYYYTIKYIFCFCASYRVKWEFKSYFIPLLQGRAGFVHVYHLFNCKLFAIKLFDYNNDKTSSESILVWTLSDLLCDQASKICRGKPNAAQQHCFFVGAWITCSDKQSC